MKATWIVAILSGASMIAVAGSAHAQEATPAPETPVADAAPLIADQGDVPSGDVVVTARMRNETLMSAPLAVTAVTAEQIQRNPNSDLRNLSQLLPNLTISSGGAGALGSFNIRGIGGANASDVGVDQAVTLVVDGVPISRGTAAAGAYFDLGSIQVLPGPQALFFGKNASAGVVALASASPTANFEGYLKAGYEAIARQIYSEGAVSGPLSDTLRARIAFRAENSEGWVKNVAAPRDNPFESDPLLKPQPGAVDDRLGGQRALAARLTLVWKPTDNFTATAKGMISDTLGDARTFGEVVKCRPGTNPAIGNQVETFGVPNPTGDCTANGVTSISAMNPLLAKNFVGARDGSGYFQSRNYIGSLRLEYNHPQFTLVSTTGYVNADVTGLGNDTFDSIVYFPGANSANDTQVSEELRLSTTFKGPLNFTTGFYLDRQTKGGSTVGRGLIFGFLPPINTDVVIPGQADILPTAIGYYPQNRAKTNTASVFGQASLEIVEGLKVEGGVRFTAVDGSTASENAYIAPFYASLFAGVGTGVPCNSLGLDPLTACLFVPSGTIVRRKFNEENWSPEATVSWKPATDILLYASYKSGYKPGGVSQPAVLLESNLKGDLEFQAEKSHGFEAGAKLDLWDRRLNLIVSAYTYKFDNLQVSQFDSATTSFFIRNAASASTKGVEVQGTLRAAPGLTFNATVDYNDGKFDSYPGAACYVGQTAAQGCVSGLQNLSGAPLQNAPHWVALGGFSWTNELGSDFKLRIDGDAKYSSSYNFVLNNSPYGRQKEYAKINARVSLLTHEDRWQISFIGRNLTNQYIVIGGTNKPGTGNAQDGFATILTGSVDRGRELAAELSVRF